MKLKFLIMLTVTILFFLVGCLGEPQVKQDEQFEPMTYPVVDEEIGYPISNLVIITEESYPIEETISEFTQGPEFKIFTPISEKDQFVTGSGPVGVPIKLVSVSEVGLVLSETIIESDGTFKFDLDEPLKSGHLIGVQLGDISGTDFNEEDFLYSDSYSERPFVGLLFDMVSVD